MADRSKIEWLFDPYLNITGATLNVARGCTKISEACFNCFITGTAPLRINHMRFDRWGVGGTTEIEIASRATILAPLGWRDPKLVFVSSLTDLWHPKISIDLIADLFAIMLMSPDQIFMLLTKRTRRQRRWLTNPHFVTKVREAIGRVCAERHVRADRRDFAYAHLDLAGGGPMPPAPNVWIGATVEGNKQAEERIGDLAATPAAVTFLSCEPICDPDFDLGEHLHRRCPDCAGEGAVYRGGDIDYCDRCEMGFLPFQPDMVIFGGESGPPAQATEKDIEPAPGLRELDLDHLRDLIEQARRAGAAVFVKQLGEPWARANKAKHRKGGDPDEWPQDLRIREFPRQVAERAVRLDGDNDAAQWALVPRLEIARTGLTSRFHWPAGTFLQGGRRGVVMRPDGSAYRTAFVEVFTEGTFMRGQGRTVTAAETAARAIYERMVQCPAAPGHGPFEARHYTNGSGFCTVCGIWFSDVLPEQPDDPNREPGLMERALTGLLDGDDTAALEIIETVAKADTLPEADHETR